MANRQVNLEGMRVIDLTQRPDASLSFNEQVEEDTSAVAKQNGIGKSSSDGNNNRNGDPGRNVILSTYNRLVPRPTDEPREFCLLSGNSISSYTELCGWSSLMPLKFFNINPTTHLHQMTNGRGDKIQAVKDLEPISLREVSHMVGHQHQRIIYCPVYVHVVAKRKVDVSVKNKQLLIFSQVIIADKSGYCVLCSMNEGLATIYNAVDVGDRLLITRYIPQESRRDYHRGLFPDSMFLKLELKLQFHSVRSHYIWKISLDNHSLHEFKMPNELFDSSIQLKIPSELEKELKKSTKTEPPGINRLSEKYYDLIGVVTYVGRIERFSTDIQNSYVSCVVDKTPVDKKLDRFIEYRWIYLVDKTSAPFPVKMYVNNITLPHQPFLVPGAIIAISHCHTVSCSYSGEHTATSHFSQLYLTEFALRYFMLHPLTFREKSQEVLSRPNYIHVMSRKDIQLVLGGTHAFKIEDRESFVKYSAANKKYYTPDSKPMARRESKRIFFDGLILRVMKVDNEHQPIVYYTHQTKYRGEASRKREEDGYKVIENFYPFPMHNNSSWYAFQRKLPPFEASCFNEARTRDIEKKIVATYKPLCGPLLMPAEMPDYQEAGPPPPLANLEKVDGPPYFLIDIVNEEARTWYTAIWKRRQFTEEEMMGKIDAAKERRIICVAELFCTEPDAPLEVNLLDFVDY